MKEIDVEAIQDGIEGLRQAQAFDFIVESNEIEGIHRDPSEAEIAEHLRFMKLDEITIEDLERFVSVYQPYAELRDRAGLDVRVGGYYPPPGDISRRWDLQGILDCVVGDNMIGNNAWLIHQDYESLHPFTDCNGRSGRMLWMWQMQSAPLGFLHHYYYQTLQGVREL